MTMNLTDALPNWNGLTETQRLLILRQEKVRRVSTRRFDLFYPETGPLRRSLYQKHLEFFRAGRTYRERCFMAANRVGKTEGAALKPSNDRPPAAWRTLIVSTRFETPCFLRFDFDKRLLVAVNRALASFWCDGLSQD